MSKGHTLVVTFSKESGVSMAKAIKMTWDLEYDMGRRRWSRDSGLESGVGIGKARDLPRIPLDLCVIRSVCISRIETKSPYAVSHSAR